MNIRAPRTIFVSLALIAALVPCAAQAATPAQIHADAADGEINGVYSMSELRAADKAVSAVQREYYGWDDLYREHLRDLVSPSSGESPSESATGRGGGDGGSKSPEFGAAASGSLPSAAPSPEVVGDARDLTETPADGAYVGSEPDDGAQTSVANADEVTMSASGGDGFPLVFALMAIPLAVLAVGVWRSRSNRMARARDREALLG